SKAQRDAEFALDQHRHHLARPQRKFELHLQRALCHCVVNPLQVFPVELRRTSEQRLGFQSPPSATPILGQPAIPSQLYIVDLLIPKTRATSSGLSPSWTLCTARSRIASSVARSSCLASFFRMRCNESYSTHCVKRNVYLLMNRLRSL